MGAKNNPWQGVSNIKIIIVIIVLGVSLLGAVMAPAEPIKSVRDLMTEPATLFDLGIVRLESYLRNNQPGKLDVSYDWERNKIQINVVRIHGMSKQEKNRTTEELRRLIQFDIQKVRQNLNVNPVTGEIDPGYTPLENCFRHAANSPRDEPANLKAELYDMTEISARMIVNRNNVFLEARVPLKGNRIQWIKFR